jgi:hypothetical protein
MLQFVTVKMMMGPTIQPTHTTAQNKAWTPRRKLEREARTVLRWPECLTKDRER